MRILERPLIFLALYLVPLGVLGTESLGLQKQLQKSWRSGPPKAFCDWVKVFNYFSVSAFLILYVVKFYASLERQNFFLDTQRKLLFFMLLDV